MCYREPSVTIYGKYDCNMCAMTVKLFDREGVAYEYINMEEDDAGTRSHCPLPGW